MLENVEEFQQWGPLNRRHHPIKKKKGQTYRKFIKQLRELGYTVQTKELIAADYGAPTMRKRFFLIARCDGGPIIWPEPTHGPADSEAVKKGLLKPYVGAYTQLDFSLPCPSIFDTSEEIKEKYGIRAVRPLAQKTMDRIARGLKKFVLDNPEPFVVQHNKQCLISPTLIQYHSETSKDGVRGQTIEDPIMTVDGSNRYGLVVSFLSKFYKTGIGQDEREPLHTITTSAGHFGEVRAFLERYGVNESNRCDQRTGRTGDNSCEKRRKVLEDCKQSQQSTRIYSDRAETDGSASEIGILGSSSLERRKTISNACTQSNVGTVCRRNTGGKGYKPQEREQTGQQDGELGGRFKKSESETCNTDRVENLQQLSKTVFKGSEETSEQGNVLRKNREGIGDISNNCISSSEFRAYTLIKYYGQCTGQDIKEPLDTVTAQDRFGLVTINGTDYQIVDIGLRMLEPRELYGCQGFPDDYIIDHDYTGKTYPRSEQVRRCGNAVCPPIPAALVRANLSEMCIAERMPNMQIETDRTGQLRFA
nr:MAG TPA: DNA cytosine methyltransferase [Caudoviricetes sp.]